VAGGVRAQHGELPHHPLRARDDPRPQRRGPGQRPRGGRPAVPFPRLAPAHGGGTGQPGLGDAGSAPGVRARRRGEGGRADPRPGRCDGGGDRRAGAAPAPPGPGLLPRAPAGRGPVGPGRRPPAGRGRHGPHPRQPRGLLHGTGPQRRAGGARARGAAVPGHHGRTRPRRAAAGHGGRGRPRRRACGRRPGERAARRAPRVPPAPAPARRVRRRRADPGGPRTAGASACTPSSTTTR
jgi:translation initiation factor IF-2